MLIDTEADPVASPAAVAVAPGPDASADADEWVLTFEDAPPVTAGAGTACASGGEGTDADGATYTGCAARGEAAEALARGTRLLTSRLCGAKDGWPRRRRRRR